MSVVDFKKRTKSLESQKRFKNFLFDIKTKSYISY